MTEEQKIKAFLRVAQTDLDGNKPIFNALLKIKGVSFSFANALCSSLGIDKKKKAGLLDVKDTEKIESLIKNPSDLPAWILNRCKDFDTGKDRHVVSSDLKFANEFDIKRMRRLKSYRGIRHSAGLPVRGQRTRSHFRTGKTVGVSKKKLKGKK